MTILKDKVVIVTSVEHRLGNELALALSRQGALIVANDAGTRGDVKDMAHRVAHQIEAEGGQAVDTMCSLATLEGAQHLIQRALIAYGRVDSLINTCGMVWDQPLAAMSERAWNTVISACLKGSFCCVRALAPYFRKQKYGRFVHLISTAALLGTVRRSNYGAAAMAVCGLSRNLAIDMSRYNVTSNCIALADPPSSPYGIFGEGETQHPYTPETHWTTYQGLAALAVCLASNRLASISGQIFGVRGTEIYLFSQPRIVRAIHRSQGWTHEDLADVIEPIFRPYFSTVEPSLSYFSWKLF